jgi:hypothetical protein
MQERLAGIALTALFLSLLGTALAVVHFVSAPLGDSSAGLTTPPPRAVPAMFVDSILLTSNRRRLEVCVDTIDGSGLRDGEAKRVQVALAMLRSRLAEEGFADNVLADLDQAQAVDGCPRAAALDKGRRNIDPRSGKVQVLGPNTSEPSSYRLQIYVVPTDLFQTWFGDQPYVAGGEEILCAGLDCAPATAGMYVTSLGEPSAIASLLHDVMGFRPFGTPTALPTRHHNSTTCSESPSPSSTTIPSSGDHTA